MEWNSLLKSTIAAIALQLRKMELFWGLDKTTLVKLFAVFFIKSVLATLKKFEKLHEDLQFDLREDLNKLLSNIFHKNMAAIALDLGLPKQV